MPSLPGLTGAIQKRLTHCDYWIPGQPDEVAFACR